MFNAHAPSLCTCVHARLCLQSMCPRIQRCLFLQSIHSISWQQMQNLQDQREYHPANSTSDQREIFKLSARFWSKRCFATAFHLFSAPAPLIGPRGEEESGWVGSADPRPTIHLKCVLMKRSGEKLTFRCKKSKAVSDQRVAEQAALWDVHSESNSIFHIMQVLIRLSITDFHVLSQIRCRPLLHMQSVCETTPTWATQRHQASRVEYLNPLLQHMR